MKHKILDFPTRLDWLNWRNSGIGSSDAPVIMGVSRFKTKEQLLMEKTLPFSGEDQSNGYIKDRGNKIETAVLKYLRIEKGNTYQLEDFPFLRAAPDGVSEDTVVEIKLLTTINVEKPNYETPGFKKFKSLEQNKIPDEYYPQCQHQLLVTGAKKCLFAGFMELKGGYGSIMPNQIKLVGVFPDWGYIQNMFSEECKFWLQVCKEKDRLKYEGELE
jgi:putative phage-type endonuclease